MTADRTQLLLNLSMELAAAKDSILALESFRRYLQNRMQPARLEFKDLEKSHVHFKKGEIVQKDKKYYRVLFAATLPLVFFMEDCANELLSNAEIDTITKIVKFFKENSEAATELRGLTYTDDLTGLYNQRYLELMLDRELSLAKRNGSTFGVLFLDLDHFKQVNDTYGHLIGSRLLYEVGQEIKKTLRESDITFRYGGDEFVMILSQTALPDAMFVAERVRQKIEKKRFLARDGMDIRLTASIGVACVPDHAITKVQILKAADEALYGVKRAVRNRVLAAVPKG